jgi:DNA repair protein RadC
MSKIKNVKVVYTNAGTIDVETDVTRSATIAAYMKDTFDAYPHQEQLWVILINAAGNVVGKQMVALGTNTQVGCTPSEIFRSAIVAGAHAIIISHNHPIGSPEPSEPDLKFTYLMVKAGRTIGIPVVDHIIFCDPQYIKDGKKFYSLRDNGKINEHDLERLVNPLQDLIKMLKM